MSDKPGKPHGEAQDAGGARRAADHAPRADTDRWSEFSLEDTRETASEPAAPAEAKKPRAGLPKTPPSPD